MKITVIEGSPHLKGASSTVASRFVEGAREAGHEVDVLEVSRLNIGPCKACNVCGTSGPCIQQDDIAKVRPSIMGSEMIVFVTPVYFCGFSAQLKTVIDRFYSFSSNLKTRGMRAVLIATAADRDQWIVDAVGEQFGGMCRYLRMTEAGRVLGTGCPDAQSAAVAECGQRAYELGRSLRSPTV